MASTERRKSISSLFGPSSKESSLAAPATPQGPAASTASLASSDRSRSNDDLPLAKSTDGARDRLRSRKNSEDARSDTSSVHHTRMAKLFKGRRKRRPSGTSQDDGHAPPRPTVRRPSVDHAYPSDESLGLAKSVASSLLTEDSDTEP